MRWWNKTPENAQLLGKEAEKRALNFLLTKGLIHVESNFRRPFGEIDLIMLEHGTLIFVEVRSRAKGRFGGAAESVTEGKKRNLVMTAQVYLQRFQTSPPCRFDVIAIDDGKIEWLKNVIEG
ncbi:putative endonuclease [Oxalobacteraceae bacterium GrIS 2.11]